MSILDTPFGGTLPEGICHRLGVRAVISWRCPYVWPVRRSNILLLQPKHIEL